MLQETKRGIVPTLKVPTQEHEYTIKDTTKVSSLGLQKQQEQQQSVGWIYVMGKSQKKSSWILFGEIERFSEVDTFGWWAKLMLMNSDISTHEREILFWGHLWIGDIQIQAFPIVMLRMSGFEGIKNYSAQDDKFFLSLFLSGVVNLLKQCSDKIHEVWKKYHCIKIQQYALNLQFLLLQMF